MNFRAVSGLKLFPLRPQRVLPTETKVDSGMSQSKSGTSVNLRNSGVSFARLPLHKSVSTNPQHGPLRVGHSWRDKWTALSGKWTALSGPLSTPNPYTQNPQEVHRPFQPRSKEQGLAQGSFAHPWKSPMARGRSTKSSR